MRERKYIAVVNGLSLFVAAYSGAMVFAARSLGHAFMLVAAAQGALLLLGPVLNARGHHLAAKLWFGGVPLVGLTAASWVSGTASGMQLYLLNVLVGSWVVFSSRERTFAWIYSASSIGLFLVLELARPAAPAFVSAAKLADISILNQIGLMVVVLGFGYWSFRENARLERELDAEHSRSERLLLNILPAQIAQRLKQRPQSIAERFPEATMLFADIVRFTELADRLPAPELVGLLDEVFTRFDALADEHGLEKIKTIGDAYFVAGGLPEPRLDHVESVARMALAMLRVIDELPQEAGRLSVRIGLHTGPVVAGVIGRRKFAYDLWGDAVNTASRMESHGVPGRIQVSQAVYEQLRGRFTLEPRGTIDVKGKGPMNTWFLVGSTTERPVLDRAEAAPGWRREFLVHQRGIREGDH